MSIDNSTNNLVEINIDTSDNPLQLLEIYTDNPSYGVKILDKLIHLNGFSQFIHVFQSELSKLTNISSNSNERDVFGFLIDVIQLYYKELAASEAYEHLVEKFLEFSTSLYIGQELTFEVFRTLETISKLISCKAQFPSKETAIVYFRLLSQMFVQSKNYISLLNSLSFLNDLESIKISEKNVNFLRMAANAKDQKIVKSLFCGLKTKDVASIKINTVNDGQSEELVSKSPSSNIGSNSFYMALGNSIAQDASDLKWQMIFDALSDNKKIEDSFENIAFCSINNIQYKRKDGYLSLSSISVSVTTKIFNFVKLYQPAIVEEEKAQETNEIEFQEQKRPQQLKQKEAEEPVPEAPKKVIEFKNRFSNLYKKFKLIRKYTHMDFVDSGFKEREENRKRIFAAMEAKFNEEKQHLANYSSTIEALRNELHSKIAEKLQAEKKDQEEKQRLEEERLREEKKKRMWRSSVTEEAKQNTTSTQPSTEADTGVYRPKITTYNAAASGIYRPPVTTTSRQGSWQSSKTDNKDKNSEDSNSASNKSWSRR